jgi:hypothetical protein
MKKIVRGNDFTLRIPVRKMVNGESFAFPLPGCTDVAVNVVNSYRRVSLSYTIDVKEDNVLNARVEGDQLACGVYALEVKGKLFGNDWRSNEYEQFGIVDNNAAGDTVFEPQEGEDSVEMDTAMVVLAPEADLSGLITDVGETLKRAEATITDVEKRTEKALGDVATAVGNADKAAENAKAQADRAKTQADHPNIIGEDGYWMKWNEETNEYVRTDIYSRGTIDYPTLDVNEDAELEVTITDGSDKRFELNDEGELLINLNNNI